MIIFKTQTTNQTMFSRPSINDFVTVQSTPITIGIIVSLTFHSFLVLLLGRGIYFSFRFPSVLPCGQPERQNFTIGRVSFLWGGGDYYLDLSGLSFGWSVWISKSQRYFCVSFFWTDSGFALIPFVRMVKFILLAQFPVDHLAHPFVTSLILSLR